MENLLESMKSGAKSEEFLFDDLNNDSIANYWVAYCRHVVAFFFVRCFSSLSIDFLGSLRPAFLRANHELYSGFIEGNRTLDKYCCEEIEPMWKDCDHIAIIALVNSVGTSSFCSFDTIWILKYLRCFYSH